MYQMLFRVKLTSDSDIFFDNNEKIAVLIINAAETTPL